MREKSHHMDDFIDPKDLKDKFNIDYEDRLEYVRNRDNLPDELVHQMQDEVLKFLTHNETIAVPGFLGKYKKEGTVFINLKMNKVGFRDNSTYKCLTALRINDKKIRRLAETDFHLFTDAGKYSSLNNQKKSLLFEKKKGFLEANWNMRVGNRSTVFIKKRPK